MLRILTFLVFFSAVEIFILMQFVGFGGSWPLFFSIFATALVGCVLARRQGNTVLSALKHELTIGRIPAFQVLEGISLLIAALLLVIPGFITDIIGGLILVPKFRAVTISLIEKQIRAQSKIFCNQPQDTENFTIDGTYTETTDTHNTVSPTDQSLPPTK